MISYSLIKNLEKLFFNSRDIAVIRKKFSLIVRICHVSNKSFYLLLVFKTEHFSKEK